AHAMVDVGHKISGLQLFEHAHRDGLPFGVGLFDLKFMIALKDLMIGKTNQIFVQIHEALTDGHRYGIKFNFGIEVFKNATQALELSWVFGENKNGRLKFLTDFKILYQELKLPIKNRLCRCAEF